MNRSTNTSKKGTSQAEQKRLEKGRIYSQRYRKKQKARKQAKDAISSSKGTPKVDIFFTNNQNSSTPKQDNNRNNNIACTYASIFANAPKSAALASSTSPSSHPPASPPAPPHSPTDASARSLPFKPSQSYNQSCDDDAFSSPSDKSSLIEYQAHVNAVLAADTLSSDKRRHFEDKNVQPYGLRDLRQVDSVDRPDPMLPDSDLTVFVNKKDDLAYDVHNLDDDEVDGTGFASSPRRSKTDTATDVANPALLQLSTFYSNFQSSKKKKILDRLLPPGYVNTYAWYIKLYTCRVPSKQQCSIFYHCIYTYI